MGITTTRSLLTGSWTADVDALEIGIRRFTSGRPVTNECRVAVFEVAGDEDLHVNVTHRHQTEAAKGWSGPGVLPQGYVHNRTFGETPSKALIRNIRDMVFAARV
jgi:hypothetical protein